MESNKPRTVPERGREALGVCAARLRRRMPAWLAVFASAALALPAGANNTIIQNYNERQSEDFPYAPQEEYERKVWIGRDMAQLFRYEEGTDVRIGAIILPHSNRAPTPGTYRQSGLRAQIIPARQTGATNISGGRYRPAYADTAGVRYLAWGTTGLATIWVSPGTRGDHWNIESNEDIRTDEVDGRGVHFSLDSGSPRSSHRLRAVRDTNSVIKCSSRCNLRVDRNYFRENDDGRTWTRFGRNYRLALGLLKEAPPVPATLDLRAAGWDDDDAPWLGAIHPTVTADGTTIVIPMRAVTPLNAIGPTTNRFEVVVGDRSPRAPDSVVIVPGTLGQYSGRDFTYGGRTITSGAGVKLTVSPKIPRGKTVDIRYEDPTFRGNDSRVIEDGDGVDAPSFRAHVTVSRNASTVEPPLVANDSEDAAAAVSASVDGRWQTIRTGSNDQESWRPLGFTVVVAEASSGHALSAEIHAVRANGTPAPPPRRVPPLAVLDERRVSAAGRVTLGPGTFALSENTTYALRVFASRGTPKLSTTASGSESDRQSRDWGLGDKYLYWKTSKTGESSWANGDGALRLSFTGFENSRPVGGVVIDGYVINRETGCEREFDTEYTATAWAGVELNAEAVQVADGDGEPDGGFEFEYAWWKDDDTEPFHHGTTFTPDASLGGSVIQVRTSFTDAAGIRETVLSCAMAVRADNGPPSFAGMPTQLQVSEHAPGGADVGPVIAAEDPDGHLLTLDVVALRAVGAATDERASQSFEAAVVELPDGRPGVQIRTKAGHTLDFETAPTRFEMDFAAEDALGATAAHTVAIDVTDGPNVTVHALTDPVAASDRRVRFNAYPSGGDVEAGTRLVFATSAIDGGAAVEPTIEAVRDGPGAPFPWRWEPEALAWEEPDVHETLQRSDWLLHWEGAFASATGTSTPLAQFDALEVFGGRGRLGTEDEVDMSRDGLPFTVVFGPLPKLTPDRDAVAVREGDAPGAVRVRLTLRTAAGMPRPAAPYSLRVRVADGPAPGGAKRHVDYAAFDKVVTFAPEDFPDELPEGEDAWSASRTFEFRIVDDGVDEGGGAETFAVELLPDPDSVGLLELADAEGNPCGPEPACAVTVTVEDDDRAELEAVFMQGGDEVVLRFSRELDADAVPAAGAFAVTVDGAPVAVAEVVVSGALVRLRLASAPARGSRVEVAYTPGDAGDAANPPLRSDNGGNVGHPVVFHEDRAGTAAGEPMQLASEADHVARLERSLGQARDAGDDDEAARLAGLLADARAAVAALDARLHEGRLRVKLKRRSDAYARWGSVCADRFAELSSGGEENQAAAVACRAMGYRTGAAIDGFYPTGFLEALTEADEPIWLDDVLCYPGARGHPEDRPIVSLADDCWHAGIALHNCDHAEDVFVRCDGGPVLESARLDPADRGVVVLAFRDELARAPSADAFEVNVGAGWRAPAGAALDGMSARLLRLSTAAGVADGARVRVRYRGPATDDGVPLQDLAGIVSRPFCAVFAAPGDGRFGDDCDGAEANAAAAADGTVTLTFDEALAAAGPAAAFDVTVDGAGRTPSAADVADRTLTLTVPGSVADGAVVAVRYLGPAAGGGLRGRDGAVAAFCVVFEAPGGDGAPAACPELAIEAVEAHGSPELLHNLRLVFNAPLDTANPAPADAFTVELGRAGNEVAITAVEYGEARTVRLDVPGTSALEGTTLRVSYADPSAGDDANALQTATYGFDAPSFCVEFERPAGSTAAWRFCGGPRPASVVGDADDDGAATAAFDRALDVATAPPAGALTVRVEGADPVTARVAPRRAEDDPQAVRLEFRNVEHPFGRPVQVAYADPSLGDDAAALQAADGSDAASFCLGFRWPGDGTWRRCGPLLRAASGADAAGGGDRDRVVLAFDRDLAAAGAPPEAFRVTADGVWLPVAAATYADGRASLRLAANVDVADGAALRVVYDDPTDGDDADAVQDARGADATSLCVEFAWPGDGAFGRCPQLASAVATVPSILEPCPGPGCTRVELAFGTALDHADGPPARRFVVRLPQDAGPPFPAVEVQFRGSGVVRLGHYTSTGFRVRLNYDDPTPGDDAGVLQSVDGVDAESFCLTFRSDSLNQVKPAVRCPDVPTGAQPLVTVSGTPAVAARLALDVSRLADFFELPAAPVYSHRWYRVDEDGTAEHIERAGTIGWYQPVAADVDKRIRVAVTFTDAAGDEYTLQSAPTGVVVAGCVENSVQLLRGTTRYEGSIEVCLDGKLGSVCDNGWNDAGAGVVCRQLGYAGGAATFASEFGLIGGTAYHFRRVACTGAEAALHLCPHERQASQTSCHFSERAGVRCEGAAAAEAVTATFVGPLVQHDGSSPFTVRVRLSAPLPASADLAGLLTVVNGTLGTVTRVDGRGDLFDVAVTPSGSGLVTVRLAGSAACGETGAVCTADGRRVAAAETVVGGALTSAFTDVPAQHDGDSAFTVRIMFSAALSASTANVADALSVDGGTLGAVTRVGSGYDLWQASVTPSDDGPVTVRLAASPPCLAAGALCAADGRRAAGAETTVGSPVTAAFTQVPEAHDGSSAFTVRVAFSEALAPATAGVAAALSVADGSLGAVTRVGGRDDLWQASVTPSGDGPVTVSLAASPACDQTGAMCTADGRRVLAGAAAEVDGVAVTVTFTDVPALHGGAGARFDLRVLFSTPLAATTADVAANVSAANGAVDSVARVDGRYDLWRIRVVPSSSTAPVTVRLAASPACADAGAMCTPAGRRVPAAAATVLAGFVGATLTGPPAHDGSESIRVRIDLPVELAATTANVDEDAVTVTNGSLVRVTASAEDDRLDEWDVIINPDGDDDVTVRLAQSPACDQPGAMCTADGRRVAAAETTVPHGTFVDVSLSCPIAHEGAEDEIVVWVQFSEALDPSTANVEDNLHVLRATLLQTSSSADLWSFRLRPTGNGIVRVGLSPSPACDQPGAMCTAAGSLVPGGANCATPGPDDAPTIEFVHPVAHDGTTFELDIQASEPLDPDNANFNSGLVITNGTTASATTTPMDGLAEMLITPAGNLDVTVRLAPSPACGELDARCTAARGFRLPGGETTIPYRTFVDVTMTCPASHSGLRDEFEVGIVFSEALDSSTANVEDNLYVTGASIIDEVSVDEDGAWTVTVTSGATNAPITVYLDPSPLCDQPGAMCTPGGSLVPAAYCSVPPSLNDDRGSSGDGVTATFTDVPASHDGASAFTVRIALSAALDKSTAAVAANVSVANGTRGAVTRVRGRYDLWQVGVTPSGDGDVTVSLAASPACGRTGAMCTKDGERVAAAATTVPGPSPAFSVADAEAAEGGGTLSFEVVLDPAAGAGATVDYATADGTATAGEDYAAASGTLAFAAGDTSRTVAVALADDDAHEDDETLTLSLSNAAGADIADGAATGTIADDDEPPPPRLSVSDASGTEGGTASFAMTLDRAPSGRVSAYYTTVAETAKPGEDYETATGTLWFEAGETSKTVDVALVDDDEVEPEETFRLELILATGADYEDPTGVGTIADDDGAAGLGASFSGVPDGHDGTRFTVGVDFSEEVEGLRYRWVADTLVTASGGTVARAARRHPPANLEWDVEIDPAAPGTDVTLSFAAAAAVPDGRTVAPGAPATVPGQSLSAADASAVEGGTATFAVTLDRGATGEVTVDYATADGTATAGRDYAAASGTLTFKAGESSKTVAVDVLADTVAEYDETFTLTLSNAPRAGLAEATATGTIEDDDAPKAELRPVPAEHGGKDQSFEAGVSFSEEIDGIAAEWVRGTLATATNATVQRAERDVADPPENRAWTLTVAPDSAADVELGLAAGLRTPDDRPLRVGGAATVRGPQPGGTRVDGAALTLVWPSARDAFGAASASDYAVAVNGAPRAVASAEIAGRRAVLVLSAPVAAGDAVTVGYVGSAMHPLADASGRVRSAPWDGVAADNVTGAETPRDGSAPAAAPALPRLATAPADATRLDASGLGLADLSALGAFATLERLDLSDNALADLAGIEVHRGLRELDLAGNRIADLGPLRALHALERLDLAGNRVADVSPLAGLPALRVLVLDGNAVTDLGPLTHLAALEHLGLAGNRVPDVTPLQDLPRLRRLDLGGNPVSDLSPLGDVASLEWIALPGQSAAAADALARLTGLRWMWPGTADRPTH